MNNSAYVFDVTENNFDDIVIKNSATVPVMVDFWASWCGPCKTLMPILSNLADAYQGKFLLAKVNSDEQQQLAGKWGVRSLPTVKIFRDGAVIREFVGAQSESNIRLLLDQLVERDSNKFVNEALVLAEQGKYENAIQLLQETTEKDPQNKRASIELLRLFTKSENYSRANEYAKTLPANVQTDADVIAILSTIDFALETQETDGLDVLVKRLENNPDNNELRLKIASHYVLDNDFQKALDYLFEILKLDKNFQDGIAKKRILKVFDMLGGQGKIVSQYRSKMFNMLH